MTPEGRRITKLDEILLNGNNIAMLIPGGEYPYNYYYVMTFIIYLICNA